MVDSSRRYILLFLSLSSLVSTRCMHCGPGQGASPAGREGARSPPPPAMHTRLLLTRVGPGARPASRAHAGSGGLWGAGGAARPRVPPRSWPCPAGWERTGAVAVLRSGRIDAAPAHRCCPAPRLITAARESFLGRCLLLACQPKTFPVISRRLACSEVVAAGTGGFHSSPLSEALFSEGQVGGAAGGEQQLPHC